MNSDEASKVVHTKENLEEGKGTTISSMNNVDQNIHEEKENMEDIVDLSLSSD